MKSGHTRLLFFAAATVLLLLNYPWLSLFSSAQLLVGLPPLLLYLFGLWVGFILIIRAILKPAAPSDRTEPPQAQTGATIAPTKKNPTTTTAPTTTTTTTTTPNREPSDA